MFAELYSTLYTFGLAKRLNIISVFSYGVDYAYSRQKEISFSKL